MRRALIFFALSGCIELGEPTDIEYIEPETTPSVATTGVPTGTPTTVQPQTVEVLIKDLAFNPDEITINAGDTVRWVMEDGGTFHFVTEGDPGGAPAFESPQLDLGDDWEMTFDKPGVYVYHCANHSTVMRGATVTVL